MENTNKGDTLQTTESIGVTEMQKKQVLQDLLNKIGKHNFIYASGVISLIREESN